MAILPIRITGDPVLHTPAQEVKTWDAKLHQLVEDMRDTMAKAPGVGLAAPQVGVPLRIFVYHWRDESGVLHDGVAINPRLLVSPTPIHQPDAEEDSEGCLSIPGERFPLVRSYSAHLSAYQLNQQPFEVTATAWLARIFQHEFDHLNGVLYADRLAPPHLEQAKRTIRRQKWGVPGLSWLPGRDDLEA